MKIIINNILNWLSYIGQFSIDHPFKTVFFVFALTAIITVVCVFVIGIAVHPGAALVGVVAGLYIGTIIGLFNT